MKGFTSRWVSVLFVARLLLTPTAVTADAADSPDKQKALETLQKAMDQAKQTGKPVTIDVTPEDPSVVQTGDLVLIHYTARLEDGTLVRTTTAGSGSGAEAKEAGMHPAAAPGPEAILAGSPAAIPGLGETVLGMAAGEKTKATLPPEKAFGPSDPKEFLQLPCEQRMPRSVSLAPGSYVGRFGTFPIVGREVNLTPYFKSRIVEVAETFVRLESLAKGGERSEDGFGTTEVFLEGDRVVTRLTPRIGAPFEMKDRKGRIVSTDGSTFMVDFNPPLAGKPVVVDLEVVSLAKASVFKGVEIAWVEDHEEALAIARKAIKPVFLLLYAPWCSWSKKIMNESMEDPRIKMMKDRFIWAKVNSEEQKDLYEFYEQTGYPLVVIVSPEGEVIKKISGYKDGGALKAELEAVPAPKVAEKK